jgi:hypothetical protein
MSYLKATDLRLSFVINFNVPHLKEDIRRIVLQPLVFFVSFVVNGKHIRQIRIFFSPLT